MADYNNDDDDDGPESLMSLNSFPGTCYSDDDSSDGQLSIRNSSDPGSEYFSRLSDDQLKCTVVVRDIDERMMCDVVRALRITKSIAHFNKDAGQRLMHITFVAKTDADQLLQKGKVPYGDISFEVSKPDSDSSLYVNNTSSTHAKDDKFARSADTAVISKKRLKEITECPICSGFFKEPKVLPCIHTYCHHCLERYGAEKEKVPGEKLDCPLCRKEFTIPLGGFKELPGNFFIIQLMQASKQPISQLRNVLCDLCSGGNESGPATVFCIKCQQHLCEPCSDKHNKLTTTKGHNVVSVAAKPSVEELMKMAPSYCEKHSSKEIEFYCYNCNKIACVVCYVDHKLSLHKCSDVQQAADEFQSQFKDDIMRVVPYILRNQNEMKQLEEHKKSLKNKVEAAKAEIAKKYHQLRSVLESHQRELISELESFQSKTLKELDTRNEEIERQLVILESFKRYCEEIKDKGSPCDIARAANDLHMRADELVKSQEEFIENQLSPVNIKFKPSPASTDKNWIGQVAMKESFQQFCSGIKDKDSSCDISQAANDLHIQLNESRSMYR